MQDSFQNEKTWPIFPLVGGPDLSILYGLSELADQEPSILTWERIGLTLLTYLIYLKENRDNKQFKKKGNKKEKGFHSNLREGTVFVLLGKYVP